MRCGDPMAKVAAATQPNPIPSQLIGYDFDKKIGFVEETLHRPEHRAIKEKIEAKGQRLSPEREEFQGDAATWAFWLASAVKAGLARIVEGKIPDDLPGKPQTNFIFAERETTTTDKLTAAIERQTTVLEKQAELFTALLDTLRSKKG
jgi:hypothetical protein